MYHMIFRQEHDSNRIRNVSLQRKNHDKRKERPAQESRFEQTMQNEAHALKILPNLRSYWSHCLTFRLEATHAESEEERLQTTIRYDEARSHTTDEQSL